MQEESVILLTVWGKEEALRGQIVGMDSRTGKVHLSLNEEITKVPFMDIMSVNYPRD
ncbi:hypothetical protein D3C73_1496080 [compost metagenome]